MPQDRATSSPRCVRRTTTDGTIRPGECVAGLRDPPELPVSQLVRLAGLFAINENRARVALSRMVATGEVSTDGSGRYRLEGDLLAQRTRGTRQCLGRHPTVGRTVVDRRDDGPRHERRSPRPAPPSAAHRTPGRTATRRVDAPDERAPRAARRPRRRHRWSAAAGPRTTQRDWQACRLWDLDGWSRSRINLVRRLERTPPSDASVLAPGFVLSASVLRHLQADPLVPTDLLPPRWSGDRLRTVYLEWDEAYREQLAAWHRATV